MKFFKWFFIGCFSVGIPFALAYNPHDLWPPLIYGALGGTAFLAFFFFSVRTKLFSRKESIVIGSLLAIFVATFCVYGVTMYRMSTYQRGTLSMIRTYISVGNIVTTELHERMVPVLHRFYTLQPAKKKSIVETFKEINGSNISEGEFRSRVPGNQHRTFVTYHGDTLVQLVSIDTVTHGKDDMFDNAAGYRGKLQYTAMLSKHGVTYERNN